MNVFKLIEDNGLNLHGDIEHFAELVAQQEREACAKVCEEVMRRYKADTALDPDLNKVGAMSAELCALWIRKRGEK